MNEKMIPTPIEKKPGLMRTLLTVFLPILLLAGMFVVFLVTNGAGLNIQSDQGDENIQIDRTILNPGSIQLDLQNLSPQAVSLSQVVVNDAFWSYTVTPTNSIKRLQHAMITINYPWVEGEAYDITLLTSTGKKFDHVIDGATQTPAASSSALLNFTLIGLYLGVIPIFLGIVWFPVLRRVGTKWVTFSMATTAGLLLFLGLDSTNQAITQAAAVGGSFQGVGLLIGIGIALIFLLLAISHRQAYVGKPVRVQRMTLSLIIAVSIGLHNLGEGLALEAAYTSGAETLGTFLVVGFVLQNITEGLGIVTPILKDWPTIRFMALSGLIAGVPAIVGAWIGGVAPLPFLNIFFLAVGAGALFEVAYEIIRSLQRDDARQGVSAFWTLSGVLVGMFLLYTIGIWIK